MEKATRAGVWYREPWPWIVMSGPALAVIGSLVSAYLAIHGADPVVDQDYYEHGLQINRQLEREQQVERLRHQTESQVERARAPKQ
ncbi:MAG TPA: FixH family protein [Burkholderiaceae bacterium]|jgi:hypothetical protein|nr:FixH family protein [Burkholderiaceae bacterium]